MSALKYFLIASAAYLARAVLDLRIKLRAIRLLNYWSAAQSNKWEHPKINRLILTSLETQFRSVQLAH
jgi:hypothetical protein